MLTALVSKLVWTIGVTAMNVLVLYSKWYDVLEQGLEVPVRNHWTNRSSSL